MRRHRGVVFYLLTVGLAASAFIGGTMAHRSLRDPSALAVLTAFVGTFFAVIWLGPRDEPTSLPRKEPESVRNDDPKDGLERAGVPKNCPNCSAGRRGRRGLHWHNLTVWCMGCGWGKNLPRGDVTTRGY